MSVLPILKEPHPVLRTPAKPVPQVTKALKRLIKDMIETMYAADGVGLAATQIGQGIQLFVANATRERGMEIVAVNPRLEVLAKTPTSVQEGCLSLPQLWSPVPRPSKVRLRALDERGRPFTLDAEGLLAVILQHECDHLKGELFVDRLPEEQRARLLQRYFGAAA